MQFLFGLNFSAIRLYGRIVEQEVDRKIISNICIFVNINPYFFLTAWVLAFKKND